MSYRMMGISTLGPRDRQGRWLTDTYRRQDTQVEFIMRSYDHIPLNTWRKLLLFLGTNLQIVHQLQEAAVGDGRHSRWYSEQYLCLCNWCVARDGLSCCWWQGFDCYQEFTPILSVEVMFLLQFHPRSECLRWRIADITHHSHYFTCGGAGSCFNHVCQTLLVCLFQWKDVGAPYQVGRLVFLFWQSVRWDQRCNTGSSTAFGWWLAVDAAVIKWAQALSNKRATTLKSFVPTDCEQHKMHSITKIQLFHNSIKLHDWFLCHLK